MAGSTFGTYFRVTTWGESHGMGVGAVVDGVPAGLPLCEEDIQKYLDRRRPGQSLYSTPRKEEDAVEILSGVFEGKTTGTPISLAVFNRNQRSRDYSAIANLYRPGHADLTFDEKYGFRDYRGGGRSSGRETIARVAGGAIAAKILNRCGIELTAYAAGIGPVTADPARFDPAEINRNPLHMPDAAAAREAEAFLKECMANQDSAGGVIECVVHGMKPGLGEPVFDKLDALLGKALFSIGAVKGVEIGDGFAAARATGRANNDPYTRAADGSIVKLSNHSGGVLGGISDGSDLLVRAALKPTPSIGSEQQTVTSDGKATTVRIGGRHDPVIVPRAVVVVESMVALTLTDLLFANVTARMDRLEEFYR